MDKYSRLIRHSGNAALFTAVEMSVVSALAGRPLHLHAEGLRGTGKTTILRAARDTLPRIERIKGCVYNCRPNRPHCPVHRAMPAEEIDRLGTEAVPMPFFEISHSAKVGTVVGSVDLAALTDRNRPVAALLPGTLPRAHRGIIFVDEINRLADTSPDLADVLLDAMGTKPGRVQIEETGLPLIELPVEATVWAASNPDEDPGPLADIRRQLSDRFDLTVNMARPNRSDVVTRILDLADGRSDNAADPVVSDRTPRPRAVELLPQVKWPSSMRSVLADIYVDFGLESLRAVEAMQQAATLRCAVDGRSEVGIPDLVAVAGLALRHRVDLALLARITAHLQSLEVKAAAALQASNDGVPPLTAQVQPQAQTQATQPLTRQAADHNGAQSGEQSRAQSGAPSATSTLSPAGQPPRTGIAQSAASRPGAGDPLSERRGFGRLLARFLGASGGTAPHGPTSDTGGPYPSAGATNGQGKGGGGGQMNGQDPLGPAGQVGDMTAPPRRARSIFDLVPDDVIVLPEDVRRV